MFPNLVSKKIKNYLSLMIPSFFSVWVILRIGNLSTRNILAPILFASFIVFFHFVRGIIGELPRIKITASILSFFFTLLFLFAQSNKLTTDLNHNLFRIIILCSSGIGLFFLFYYAISALFSKSLTFSFAVIDSKKKWFPIFSFFLCLLFWLPYFLYEFPGIMSPDSINQFEQVLGMVPYSNHHPWAHTLLLGFFYTIGDLFTNDVTVAISFFTFFQMCFMAFAIAWLMDTLQRLGVGLIFCICTLAFYILVPYNGVLAVTIWKDVLFSGAVLLFTVSILRLLFLKKQNGYCFTLVIYGLSGLIFCLFRTNGWYAFLASLPFLIYMFRKQLKVMLPLHLTLVIVVLLFKGPVMNTLQIEQPDFVESICIPLQQVSRVIVEERTLSKKQWDTIHRVMDTTYIQALYAPGFADNMKELVRAGNPQYLAEHKGEYLSLWLQLGIAYPFDYLAAYRDQTIGYWFPDVNYPVADMDGVIANKTGVVSRPLLGGPFVVKAKEIFLKLGDMIPLYGLLWSMGAMLWFVILCIGITMIRKEYSKWLVFLPGLFVILTLLVATPVSSEFRYAYSLIICMPVYLITCFLKKQ